MVVPSDCRKTMIFDKKREFERNSLKIKMRFCPERTS